MITVTDGIQKWVGTLVNNYLTLIWQLSSGKVYRVIEMGLTKEECIEIKNNLYDLDIRRGDLRIFTFVDSDTNCCEIVISVYRRKEITMPVLQALELFSELEKILTHFNNH